jgi:hypothetical protein
MSPYYDGVSYELFEAIEDNNMRFEQLKEEVNGLFLSVAKEIAEKQDSLFKKIEEVTAKVEGLQYQIHNIHRELSKQKSVHAQCFQQLVARIIWQDRIIASMNRKLDTLARLETLTAYPAYYPVPSSTFQNSK